MGAVAAAVAGRTLLTPLLRIRRTLVFAKVGILGDDLPLTVFRQVAAAAGTGVLQFENWGVKQAQMKASFYPVVCYHQNHGCSASFIVLVGYISDPRSAAGIIIIVAVDFPPVIGRLLHLTQRQLILRLRQQCCYFCRHILQCNVGQPDKLMFIRTGNIFDRLSLIGATAQKLLQIRQHGRGGIYRNIFLLRNFLLFYRFLCEGSFCIINTLFHLCAATNEKTQHQQQSERQRKPTAHGFTPLQTGTLPAC